MDTSCIILRILGNGNCMHVATEKICYVINDGKMRKYEENGTFNLCWNENDKFSSTNFSYIYKGWNGTEFINLVI